MKKLFITTALVLSLTFTGIAQASAASARTVQAVAYVNVHASDSTSSKVIGQLKPNQTVTYIGGNQYWTAILFNGKQAYVSALPKYTKINGAAPATPAPVKPAVSSIIAFGEQFMGAPYAFSNTVIKGDQFVQGDCSGFTKFVFGHFGIKLSAGSKNQALNGTFVSRDQLQAGDLIFTDTNRDGVINHVSIYMGNDQLLHTYKVGVGVTITKFSGSIYDRTYVTARRVL